MHGHERHLQLTERLPAVAKARRSSALSLYTDNEQTNDPTSAFSRTTRTVTG